MRRGGEEEGRGGEGEGRRRCEVELGASEYTKLSQLRP